MSLFSGTPFSLDFRGNQRRTKNNVEFQIPLIVKKDEPRSIAAEVPASGNLNWARGHWIPVVGNPPRLHQRLLARKAPG